jgi:hypothetical protein
MGIEPNPTYSYHTHLTREGRGATSTTVQNRATETVESDKSLARASFEILNGLQGRTHVRTLGVRKASRSTTSDRSLESQFTIFNLTPIHW